MDQLGETYRIPILNVSEGDVGVLLGPPIVGLFLGTTLGGVIVVPAALLGLLLGGIVVAAAPAHLSAWAWVRTVGRYYLLRPTWTLARPAGSVHDATQGGAVQYTPFDPAERTQDLTAIRRAWPGAGAVECEDGAMEAVIEVSPANMDFAMSDDWAAVQAAGETFANTELEFPLTIHATTRPFPAERLVAQLDDRLDDPDVQAAPALAELITEYRETRPTELADTRQHRHYLGVKVTPSEVASRYERARTPGERLATLPIIGVLLGPFITRRQDHTAAERRQAMFERLDKRLRTVRTEFVEDVTGWSATRLSTLELFVLAAEFWNGTAYDEATTERLVRTDAGLAARRREVED
jgi:hypothetical protein